MIRVRSAVLYRLSQLRASLTERLSPEDLRWSEAALSEAERPLFRRMPIFDRTHSVGVAREVERMGGDAFQVRAALLHDCGKTLPPHGVPHLYRGLVVVLHALSPRLLRLLARPWGFLWPMYLHLHHPEVGARALEEAGSPPEVADLVRHHQEPSSDPRLQALQRADARH